jgi:hypothetical protein
MEILSRDSEHLIRGLEKNDPARRPRSRNCDVERRDFGDGLRRRL